MGQETASFAVSLEEFLDAIAQGCIPGTGVVDIALPRPWIA